MTFLTEGMTSTASVEWGTPQSLFAPLHDLYDFTLDPAASHANALLPRYCTIEGTFDQTGPEGDRKISGLDGLDFPWKGERIFLNPPWGRDIDLFLRKVRNEHLRNGVLVVVTLPTRPDTAWFHEYVLPYARIRWLRGRVAYIDPETEERASRGLGPRTGPPVGTMIATYR